jgi:hypothetical protein
MPLDEAHHEPPAWHVVTYHDHPPPWIVAVLIVVAAVVCWGVIAGLSVSLSVLLGMIA